MSTQKGYDNYRPLGAFRFCLAVLVMLQHYAGDLAPEPIPSALAGLEIGSVAVLAFFALSGFVIAEAVARIYVDRPLAFITNRLLRIVPHFLTALALAIVIYAIFAWTGTLRIARHDDGFSPASLSISNIALNVLGFLPLGDRMLTYNFLDIVWAIRVEMMFYLWVLCALLATAALRAAGWARPSVDRIGAMIVIPAMPLFGLSLVGRAPAMFQFAPYFALGWTLYAMTERRTRIVTLAAVLALGAVALQFLMQDSRHPTFGFERAVAVQTLLLAALLFALAILGNLRARDMTTDRRLGDLTYPLYLYHQPLMVALLSMTLGYSYWTFGLGLASSLLVAALMGRAVDPFVNRLRDAVRGRPTAKVVETGPNRARQATGNPAGLSAEITR